MTSSRRSSRPDGAGRHAFRAELWRYPGQAGWHFITLPRKVSAGIRRRHGIEARGWGSLPILARIGAIEWKTSIFPDSKSGCYLFPVKAEVRKKEGISDGDRVAVVIRVRGEL